MVNRVGFARAKNELFSSNKGERFGPANDGLWLVEHAGLPARSLAGGLPDELVRTLDMDITDPGFWDAGLSILDGMVTQIEELAASSGHS